MLLLHMLLLFALGTSVAAIPVSQQTPREPWNPFRKIFKKPVKPVDSPSADSEPTGSVAMSMKRRINGVWKLKDVKQVYHDSTLKIEEGAIVQISPEPDREWKLCSMLCHSNWIREESKPVKVKWMIFRSQTEERLMFSGCQWNDAVGKYETTFHLLSSGVSTNPITLQINNLSKLPGSKKDNPAPESVREA